MIIKRKLENIQLSPVLIDILTILNQADNCLSLMVGGSVRDAILNIVPKDIDIEVYGMSYEKMSAVLCQFGSVNFVGKSFGIIKFTPKNTQDIYDFSIPRKENKIGIKHQDFEIIVDEKMSVKDAALRRDFTMNSLAYNPITFEIYDYFGGLADIENKIIRHTSKKFSEDALRVLRAMQFQARFGFEITIGTLLQMRLMTKSEEFACLPKERLFEEWMKWAEEGTHHHLIFEFMRLTGLIDLYPFFKLLKETPQDAIYHPEGDVEVHTALCLAHMDKIIERERITGKEKAILVLSVLFHDIAKPPTTEEKQKRGRITITSEGHEELGGQMVLDILPQFGFHQELILPISKLVANHLAGVNISMIEKPSSRNKSVKRLSRRLVPATIKQLLYVMEADTNGRGGTEFKEPTGSKDILAIADEINVVEKPYQYILMGRHLLEIGLKPSPHFKKILDRSYEAQENGDFSDIEGAKKWLNENVNEICQKA